VQLEQLCDPEMYTMCEKGIRGGLSVISHRHAKANNKYLKEHDATKPSSYLMYVDANNLYGVPMSAKLPVRNFRWGDNCLDQPAVMQLEDCILEVDVGYPAELHDAHNDYPLLPVHKDITEADLSPTRSTAWRSTSSRCPRRTASWWPRSRTRITTSFTSTC